MAVFYVNAADFIRDQRFPILAPAYYHPNMSNHSLIPSNESRQKEKVNPFRFVTVGQGSPTRPSPVRPNVEADEMQYCSYTVEIMVDMFRKQIPFEIINDDDIVAIFDGVDRYLVSLKADVEAEIEESVIYAGLVLNWREQLYKHYFRYMKMHPTALQELYPNFDKQNNIFSLLLATGGLDVDENKLDPLKARRKPPITINVATKINSNNTSSSDEPEETRDPFASSFNEKFDMQGFLNEK